MSMFLRARVLGAAVVALALAGCGDSGGDPGDGAAGAGGAPGDAVVREGAPVGAECRSRGECGETAAEAITCGCTGDRDVAQCTPFGREGDACHSYDDQSFDLTRPLCGSGLLCVLVSTDGEGVCERQKSPGEACERGRCAAGSWCQDGVCAALLPLGAPCLIGEDQPCAAPNHCSSGLQGTCVPPVALGEECEPWSAPNDPCGSDGHCPGYVISPDTFTCRPGGKPDGVPCSDAVQCASRVCQQGTCGLKACQRASPATP